LSELFLFLIDDDEDDRELFLIALNASPVATRCLAFDDCSQALRELRASSVFPDYIFLDLNMPGMDGRECLSELKKQASLRHIPVVIFTTSADSRDMAEARSLGAIDFITKPSKVSELTHILTAFLNKNK
jgi:CheY-like chemotaxis protein